MSRRRRHRKRWSIQDFDHYISEKISDGCLELKRLFLGAPYLVKVLRGKACWIHPANMEPGESIVGYYPASAKPGTDERTYDPYRQMEAEGKARRIAAEEEEARRIATELASAPPPRRPPARRPWRSFERHTSRSRAA